MIRLKALFDNPDRVLWPGQFVNVQARLRLEHNRIVVPSRTVQTGPQGKYVWVMNETNATVAMRPVHVLRNYQGAKKGEEAVIESGLKPGEMVISEGQMRLAPGVKVRVLKSNTELGDGGPANPGAGS
jgi:membrane fusion protein, multidrug efflux system